jgi:hypothetical protein
VRAYGALSTGQDDLGVIAEASDGYIAMTRAYGVDSFLKILLSQRPIEVLISQHSGPHSEQESRQADEGPRNGNQS